MTMNGERRIGLGFEAGNYGTSR